MVKLTLKQKEEFDRASKNPVHMYGDPSFRPLCISKMDPDLLSCPVIHAYAPERDAWRATGLGTAKTLSMACRLIYLLKNILGEKLTLEKMTWTGTQNILSVEK